MRPLYDARLEDLGPDDRVRVECVCGHVALLQASGFIQGMRLPPHAVVVQLARKMRCQCGRKGQVDVSIRWGD
jgi:hypothetical protein